MRASRRACRAWAAGSVRRGRGADDEPTQDNQHGDRGPVPKGHQGRRQGPDPRRAVCDHGVASQPCSQRRSSELRAGAQPLADWFAATALIGRSLHIALVHRLAHWPWAGPWRRSPRYPRTL